MSLIIIHFKLYIRWTRPIHLLSWVAATRILIETVLMTAQLTDEAPTRTIEHREAEQHDDSSNSGSRPWRPPVQRFINRLVAISVANAHFIMDRAPHKVQRSKGRKVSAVHQEIRLRIHNEICELNCKVEPVGEEGDYSHWRWKREDEAPVIDEHQQIIDSLRDRDIEQLKHIIDCHAAAFKTRIIGCLVG